MEAVEKPEGTIPGNSSRLAGNPNWGTATVVGIFAGMLYGGSKEASTSVSKDAEVMLKMGSTQDKQKQHRLMRDAMEKRFTRVTLGSLIGWLQLKLMEKANEGNNKEETSHHGEVTSGVGAAIERLEQQLRK